MRAAASSYALRADSQTSEEASLASAVDNVVPSKRSTQVEKGQCCTGMRGMSEPHLMEGVGLVSVSCWMGGKGGAPFGMLLAAHQLMPYLGLYEGSGTSSNEHTVMDWGNYSILQHARPRGFQT